MSKKQMIATALLGITVALILWFTILSRESLIGTSIKYNVFHTFVSFTKEIQRGKISANFLGNIILFLPVGILLPLVNGKQKWQRDLIIGFGLSLFIEIVQLMSDRGCFDPDDIILNTLGTALGFTLFHCVEKYRTT